MLYRVLHCTYTCTTLPQCLGLWLLVLSILLIFPKSCASLLMLSAEKAALPLIDKVLNIMLIFHSPKLKYYNVGREGLEALLYMYS